MSSTGDPLLTDLNPEQRDAVQHREGPLLILAGAGTGKTRVITHRAAYLVREGAALPWEILCVTFTNKAAREMRQRLRELLPGEDRLKVSTFHSFGLDLIRQGIHPQGVYSGSMVLDEDDCRQLLETVLADLGLDPRLISPQVILHGIEEVKNRAIQPDKIPSLLGGSSLPLSEIYSLYERRLREGRFLDFGDLLYLPVQALRESQELRERLSRRFRFIMVDEYQDTNPAQYALVRLLAGDHGNVAVVGDDDQAIYRWRGADIRNILEFERDFPNARVICLERNYRSTQVILDAAWAIVRHNRNRKEKRLWTEKKGGEKIGLNAFLSPKSEAEWVVEEILRETRSGVSLNSLAVFYRINAQSRVLEESLRRRQVPYRIYGNIGFYERKEIKDLLAYLRLLRNPYDYLALERALSFPRHGIGAITLGKLRELTSSSGDDLFVLMARLLETGAVSGAPKERLRLFLQRLNSLKEKANTLPVSQILTTIIEEFGFRDALYKEYGEEVGEDRWQNIEELLLSVHQWEESVEEGLLSTYLDQVLLVQEWGAREGEEAVNLMTLHSAKGLEFHTVFIVGFEEDLLPHSRSRLSEEELEEERRLAYVGITRARHKVYLSYCFNRPLPRGGERPSYPSRFLQEIPPYVLEDLTRNTPFDSPLREDHPATEVEFAGGGYRVGELLEHPLFGVGTIIRVEDGSSGVRLTIRFAHGVKTILPRYVQLRRL